MYDYVADYAAKYAADAVAKEGAQVFWRDVYDAMIEGYTEDQALKILDSKGAKRAKYPRPEGFPSCLAENA